MLASSLEKFQTSTASFLLVALQGRAVSVCGKPKNGKPHSTFMLLLEDQESHWEAKQAQSLSKPKERLGAKTFRDFPLPLECTSLPEVPSPEGPDEGQGRPWGCWPTGLETDIYREVNILPLPWVSSFSGSSPLA